MSNTKLPKKDISFGKLLRSYRQRKGFTMELLALDTDLSSKSIYFFENGQRNPSRRTICLIAKGLELNPEESNRLLAAAGHSLLTDEETIEVELNKHLYPILKDLLINLSPFGRGQMIECLKWILSAPDFVLTSPRSQAYLAGITGEVKYSGKTKKYKIKLKFLKGSVAWTGTEPVFFI